MIDPVALALATFLDEAAPWDLRLLAMEVLVCYALGRDR